MPPKMQQLISLITSSDPAIRDQSLDAICAGLSVDELLAGCAALDDFRRSSKNLYERVRALFFLYAIHRFHLPARLAAVPQQADQTSARLIPFRGYEHLLHRRFEEAIEAFLSVQGAGGPGDGISSALATAYHRLAFQTLADQVRRSVRSVRGNQWMFRMGHPADQPLRIRAELLKRSESDGTYPILRERTPVRMDLTHSAWSDIFFLGMDYPEGAKVLNVSIDLGVHGRDAAPIPPVEAYFRVIEEPVLRLTSVDLGTTADITHLADVFDFAKDYLGLLKAAVIASGIVPSGLEGSGQSLAALLARIVGPGRGLEIVSNVNNIPKGSRLAVSTNLLAALISVCMRATGQTSSSSATVPAAHVSPSVPLGSQKEKPTGTVGDTGASRRLALLAVGLTGPLCETDRRLVLARALLGEWLGGSGGGWQDSGGVWPGMKLIEGVVASEGDPEFGISRGRLMPQHCILDHTDASAETRRKLQDSLVLVHGGMAQNVGPILEMVTEKYLLRSAAEWQGRREALGILDEVLEALKQGDVRSIGAVTTRNFQGPIQAIIPWASTSYTELLIERVRAEFGESFWGFWMLGGMSGGGMGFIFAPERKIEAQSRLQEIMSATKRELQHALPFAMEPVVYDFAINERGTFADLLEHADALMPQGYYALTAPTLLRQELRSLSDLRRIELDKFGAACRTKPELRGMVQTLFDVLLPRGKTESAGNQTLSALLDENGFDRAQHEQIRADLKEGRIGLAQNRLPASAVIEDVRPEDVIDARTWPVSSATVAVAAVSPGVPPGSPIETPTGTVGDTGASRRLAPLPFRSFDKTRPASIRSRYLPHWQQDGATYFVTFRLADSLPVSVIEELLRERDEFCRNRKDLVPSAIEKEWKEFYREKLEAELDRGHGGCALNNVLHAEEVEKALRRFDGQRYWLGHFVIMPNHVHVIVRPIMGHELSEILHSWKSFTAHRINSLQDQSGQFWQHESFDHIVREESELEKFSSYIVQNPEKARLGTGHYRLGHGSSVSSATVPVAAGSPGVRPGSSKEMPTGTVGDTGASRRLAPLRQGDLSAIGIAALQRGEVAVVTLAAGAGSRWTQGAGVVKALHPFCKLAGHHRTFIETHLAKSRRTEREVGTEIPHIFTTGHLTHEPTADFLAHVKNYGYSGPLHLSRGKSVGLRLVPSVRDLRFAWEEMPQQMLDEQQQKVRDSLRAALIGWAGQTGEASDYTDNLPLQCLHPVGHWYEVPNLLRNGVLAQLLHERPQLKHLLLHNIDTLGANLDPALLGSHIQSQACLTFEVITRRLEDRGGGLARVNGRTRLVEGLAMPREEAEFSLTYYNSNTCWIDLDKLLAVFDLTREDIIAASSATVPVAAVPPSVSLGSPLGGKLGTPTGTVGDTGTSRRLAPLPAAAVSQEKITAAIRTVAAKMPTYVTIKEVKKRWGHGQEDVFPVAQFEKLWVDMTALPEIDCRFVIVPRARGQQLKDQAQLDGWLRDGSAAHVERLCEWS